MYDDYSFKYFRFQSEPTAPYGNIEHLLSDIKCHDDVKYISIDSTLGRHFQKPTDLPADHMLITGRRRGKALITCTREERDGWEGEYDDAVKLFCNQLGLEVNKILCERAYILFTKTCFNRFFKENFMSKN